MFYSLYLLSYILLIPVLIFTLWAQIKVKTTFNKSSKVLVGLTGAAAARRILDENGLTDVQILRVRGHLTDHYDPRANVIRLSDKVYDANTAAAVGVAAHEAGHAVQYATGYHAIRLRMAMIPVCQFGSYAAMPLFFIGFYLGYAGQVGGDIGYAFMLAGILFYALATFFQLVTLPVEFNASNRAMEALERSRMMNSGELAASRRVLSAAAMTYVAALFSSLVSLLRLISIAGGRRRR